MAVTVTAFANPTGTPPSVQVTVTSTAATSVTLVRQRADGSVEDVRTPDGGPLVFGAAGSQVITDPEAPYGQPLLYMAGGAYSETVTVNVAGPWLVHVGSPGKSVRVVVQDLGERQTSVRQGMFEILGRSRPLPVGGGPRTSPVGTCGVFTATLAEANALEALLADGAVLLLNVPADRGWRLTTEYLAVGDVVEKRIARVGSVADRAWVFSYRVVDAPIGGTQDTGGPVDPNGRTWADLAVELTAEVGHPATWADAAAKYDTWADAAAGSD